MLQQYLLSQYLGCHGFMLISLCPNFAFYEKYQSTQCSLFGYRFKEIASSLEYNKLNLVNTTYVKQQSL